VRLLTLPLELSILLALALALAVWQRHPSTRGRRTLILLCLGVCAAALGEWLTLRGFVVERVGDRIKYLGSLTLAPLWLGFAAQVAGLEIARRVPWFPALLLTPAACVYLLLFSTAYASLFHVTVVEGDDLRGPLWFVVTTYHQALCALACAILAASAMRMRDSRRALRALLVALVPMAALVGGTLHRGGLLEWPYDAHPVLLGAGLLLMRDALLGGGLLDTLPFPQRELLRQLPLGLVLTDRGGAVALINNAAARALGVAQGEALGRNVEDLLARARTTGVEERSLKRGGRAAGRLLVFGA
jgi:PAS domain-containing protein